VLNPSGVRFGSGEIYGVLERPVFATRIDDAICVGQRRPHDKDERVLLFIKMRAGHKLDTPFEEAIRAAIKAALSSRHVPAHIFEVKEIPVSTLLGFVAADVTTTTRIVYGKRQEDRDCGEEDRVGNAGRPERHGCEPGVIGELLRIPGYREVSEEGQRQRCQAVKWGLFMPHVPPRGVTHSL
jgi:hypothetical protein